MHATTLLATSTGSRPYLSDCVHRKPRDINREAERKSSCTACAFLIERTGINKREKRINGLTKKPKNRLPTMAPAKNMA